MRQNKEDKRKEFMKYSITSMNKKISESKKGVSTQHNYLPTGIFDCSTIEVVSLPLSSADSFKKY